MLRPEEGIAWQKEVLQWIQVPQEKRTMSIPVPEGHASQPQEWSLQVHWLVAI